MTLEQSLQALKSAFTSKSSEAEKLAAEISELKAKNETMAAEFSAVSEKLAASAALAVERDALASKVDDLTKALAAAQEVKAQAVAQIETVGKESAKIAAAVGVSPVEISAADQSAQKSPEEIWTEYCAMTDPAAKLAFYNKNRAAIISHLGVK
jgi:chromosome segregation ATPase